MEAFDYDTFWRDARRDDWRRLRLHWHCHTARMEGDSYGDEIARRDPLADLAPMLPREWLDRSPRTIRHVALTPEDAVGWLRTQWEPVKGQVGEEAAAIPDATRFGMALYDLRRGSDLCWGFWLGPAVHLHLAVVGTDRRCH